MEDLLYSLFRGLFGCDPSETVPLTGSGSRRRYCRMKAGDVSVIGVTGTDREENRAFLYLARHFAAAGIRVPQILAVSGDEMAYIQEDLGTESLFDRLAGARAGGTYSAQDRALLCRTLAALPKIQFAGAAGLDWTVCYPEPAFGERMVHFDLNYFKYCFLKAVGPEFNEVRLQEDFDRLCACLCTGEDRTFMYRDFQARNVMIRDGEPFFIDFQGGRRGPVHYDVASFVWQARARYPEDLRDEMIAAYLGALRTYAPDVDEAGFRERLRLFALFRSLQVLGAYGFRGYFEKKPHFLSSIPSAMDNLRGLLRTPFTDFPYLNGLLEQLVDLPRFRGCAEDGRLQVDIISFSFRKGIPEDPGGNGGGYVFDCRSVNNPGRFEYYRQFTGMDPEVIRFLEEDGEVTEFLEHAHALVATHVRRYMERRFTRLQVCFGCTGGQHRSVYCAERLAARLSREFDVRIRVIHREQGIEYVK